MRTEKLITVTIQNSHAAWNRRTIAMSMHKRIILLKNRIGHSMITWKTRAIKSYLNISSHQIMTPFMKMCYTELSCRPMGPCVKPKKKKKLKSLPMLLLTLCKQMVRPSFSPTYWRRKSRTGGCFHRAFRPTDWLASVHGTGKYFAYHQRKNLNTNNVTFFFS